MRPHLGAALWGEFVAHANRHYKARWLRAFAPASGVLRCVGALDGAPCAHGALVDLTAGGWDRGAGTGEWGRAEREVGAALERLHLDHERPLHATCHRWRAAMPAAPRSWDDGLDGAALCHDLFGVCASAAHGPACVRFRCGPPRDAEGLWCCSLWTTRTATGRSWLGWAWGSVFFVVAGGGKGSGDSVVDLREGVCCVLCVFVCVCVSPPEALQRGCAYSFVHYHSPP